MTAADLRRAQMFLGDGRKPTHPFCSGFSMTHARLFFSLYHVLKKKKRKLLFDAPECILTDQNMPMAKMLTELSKTFHLVSD